ncbi:murein transglycosylase A [Sulfurimonas gotlandica]|uniref:murein transglycosylase A n=1 Tax=Sulfurimonas gotlandica TaxID=1176482 RepID=UPI001F51D9FD|nr:MltA domain-containing protein [Sulfurimonas gotlandica]
MTKKIILIITISMLFFGCSKEPEILNPEMPRTYLTQASFDELPSWEEENYEEAISSFVNSCQSIRTKKIYSELCLKAEEPQDAKAFLENEFNVYKIASSDATDEGLLTGYYEPSLRGSLVKKEPFIYPIYNEPNDLISVDLSSIYPDLKDYRLRGRIEGKKLVPYLTRAQMKEGIIDAEVICYTDSKVDLFFLEVQGSGRVNLENGASIFIGFSNQNGHKYSSIGKYLINIGEIPQEDISLQSIRAWFKLHPHRVDEVLHHNESVVYFKEKKHAASGSLGVILTPERSVAVDRNFIPLGSMLFLDAKINKKNVSRVVMAEDTGGAIKGAIRADMFFGSSEEAQINAGELKSPLKLWIFLPKGKE